MDWQQLIKERDEWIAHNFPNPQIPNPQESILGVIEEVGELAHAHLKGLQNIRGTQEEHDANAKDAIGDATVYLLGVLSYHNTVPGDSLPQHVVNRFDSAQGCIIQASKWTGTLRLVSDLPDPRVIANRAGRVVGALRAYCLIRGWDYESIVHSVWNKVKKRDWIANPQDGNEEANWPELDESLERAADRIHKGSGGE